jgi:hypothetical protein
MAILLSYEPQVLTTVENNGMIEAEEICFPRSIARFIL